MSALVFAAQDSKTLLGRELRHTLRNPFILIGSTLVPVVMLLLFVYVFGGAIGAGLAQAAPGARYVDFLVPGILVMTVAAGTGVTAIGVCLDQTGGIVDRFRTMAVTPGAILAGHVGVMVLRALLATAAVTAVALVIGFRPQASAGDWLAIVGVIAAFAFALGWLSVALGLVTKGVASANTATLPVQLLLPFLSSAFVPPASMPEGVRWFTANQPFTAVADCLRALLMGAPAGDTAMSALAWSAAIALVGFVWAVAAFRPRVR